MADAYSTPGPTTATPARGLVGLTLATAAVAALGWAVLLIAARVLGPDGYGEFSVFWGLYFGLLGCVIGLQQETTRSISTRLNDRVVPAGHQAPLVATALGMGLILAGTLLFTSLLWGERLLGSSWAASVGAVAIGTVAFAGQSAVAGVLTGTGHWNAYGALITADAGLRLVAVAVASLVGAGLGGFIWGTVSGTLAWLVLLRSPTVRSTAHARGDVGVTEFLNRCAHAMAGTASTAVLVTGFPVLLSVTSDGDLGTAGGVVLAAVTVTRAPLLMPLSVFQGVAITRFVARRATVIRALAFPMLLLVPATAIGAALGSWVGPALLRTLFGPEFDTTGGFMAALIVAGGVLAALTLTGSAVLASDRHLGYALGWLVAAVSTTAILATELSLTRRTALALCFGPLAGVLVHLSVLVRSQQELRSTSRVEPVPDVMS